MGAERERLGFLTDPCFFFPLSKSPFISPSQPICVHVSSEISYLDITSENTFFFSSSPFNSFTNSGKSPSVISILFKMYSTFFYAFFIFIRFKSVISQFFAKQRSSRESSFSWTECSVSTTY